MENFYREGLVSLGLLCIKDDGRSVTNEAKHAPEAIEAAKDYIWRHLEPYQKDFLIEMTKDTRLKVAGVEIGFRYF